MEGGLSSGGITCVRARSDVGPLIDEHAAAGEGSVHFGLLAVRYRDQHVVLKFLKNLREKELRQLQVGSGSVFSPFRPF